MPLHPEAPDRNSVDRVFAALAHPTRRQVVEQLSRQPASTSELAAPFDMALPSFLEHLKVLEACGLVGSRKVGRVRTWRLHARPLRQAERWLDRQRAHWEARLDRFDAYVTHLKEQEP